MMSKNISLFTGALLIFKLINSTRHSRQSIVFKYLKLRCSKELNEPPNKKHGDIETHP